MNNIAERRKELEDEIVNIQKKLTALAEIEPKMQGYEKDFSIGFGNYPASIDFDYPGREQVIELIQHFKAGKWDKQLSNSEGKIDYINKTMVSLPVRIYGAEPPPSCKIVEEVYDIPARPATTGVRRKVVCVERGLPAL